MQFHTCISLICDCRERGVGHVDSDSYSYSHRLLSFSATAGRGIEGRRGACSQGTDNETQGERRTVSGVEYGLIASRLLDSVPFSQPSKAGCTSSHLPIYNKFLPMAFITMHNQKNPKDIGAEASVLSAQPKVIQTARGKRQWKCWVKM